MIVVKEIKFNEEEYKIIANAADLIGEWRDNNDGYEVDKLMVKLIADTYGASRPSPDIDGWLEFIRTMLDTLAEYIDEHYEED